MPHHTSWPCTERAFAALSESGAAAVRARDDARLDEERSRVAPHIAARMKEPVHSVFRMMREWEVMVGAVEAAASGRDAEPRPLLDDYLFVLETRAGLEEALHDLAAGPPAPLAGALASLDARFLAHTVPDDPADPGTLARWLAPLDRRPPPWLWNRRPRVAPW